MSEKRQIYGSRSKILGQEPEPFEPESVVESEGTVEKIYYTDKDVKAVDIRLVNGGYVKRVPFPSGTIDPDSGNLHGDLIPPVTGQRVMVGFSSGSSFRPFVSALIFRAGYSKDSPLYRDFEMEEGELRRSHRSGGYQRFIQGQIETGFKNNEVGKVTQSEDEVRIGNGYGQSTHQSGNISSSMKEGRVEQSSSGVILGVGGPSGHKPVAVVEENKVLTLLGLQPILPAPTRVAIFSQKVKA